MSPSKRKKLEKTGWRVGDTQQFLGLTNSEMALIEISLQLANIPPTKPQLNR